MDVLADGKRFVMPHEMCVGTEWKGAQLAVAVFDDWDALQATVTEMEMDSATAAVLHARGKIPAKANALNLLKQTTDLHFERSRQHIACTAGRLATELAGRSAAGARSLADALHDWLGCNRARELESHLARGHLVLCVELRTADDFSIVCGRLVQASPHMVDLCKIGLHA
jgi:hypothetical protein